MSDLGLNRKPVLLEDKAAVGPRQYCGIHNAEHAVRVQIRCWNVPGRSTSRSIDSENDSHISDVNPFRICRVSVLRQDAVRLIIVRIDSQTAPRGTEVTAMNRINLKLDPIPAILSEAESPKSRLSIWECTKEFGQQDNCKCLESELTSARRRVKFEGKSEGAVLSVIILALLPCSITVCVTFTFEVDPVYSSSDRRRTHRTNIRERYQRGK